VSDAQTWSPLPVVISNWWALVLHGLFNVVFGLAALLWPSLTLLMLLYLFAAYALVDGVFAIVAALRPFACHTRGWWLLVEAVIGILTGLVVTLFLPGITALVLLYVIAAWFVFTGIVRTIATISLRRQIENEWLMVLSGMLSIVFGIVLAVLPVVGLLSLAWLIGIYTLTVGILAIALGLGVRRHEGAEAGRRVN
jgi:uncharacterized membrane protein HdeD (DUF308 family)